jgi:hypothetical protein
MRREKVVLLELKYNFNVICLVHLIIGDGNYLRKRNIIRIYIRIVIFKVM